MIEMESINGEAGIKKILDVLKELGGEIEYKTLKEALVDKFKGNRLRLKTMKKKWLV